MRTTSAAASRLSSGTAIVIDVPAPGLDRMSSVPPIASIRSPMLSRPKPLAPRCLDVEPHAVVRQPSARDRSIRRADRCRRHGPRCASSAFCSASCTMRNSDTVRSGGKLDGTLSCVNVIAALDCDSSRWSAWSAATRPISRSFAGCRRCDRSCTLLAMPVRAVQRFARERFAVWRNGAAQQLEIDRQQRHLLADVVVQLAGDPGALGVLGVQQPRRRDRGCARSCSQRRPRCRAPVPRPAAAVVAARAARR